MRQRTYQIMILEVPERVDIEVKRGIDERPEVHRRRRQAGRCCYEGIPHDSGQGALNLGGNERPMISYIYMHGNKGDWGD